MIEHLNDSQLSLLQECLRKAEFDALNTDPADKELAEKSITKIYEFVWNDRNEKNIWEYIPEPPEFLWFDSPWQIACSKDILNNRVLGQSLWEVRWRFAHYPILENMAGAVKDQLHDRFVFELNDLFHNSSRGYDQTVLQLINEKLQPLLISSIKHEQRDKVWASLQNILRDDLWENLRYHLEFSLTESHWITIQKEIGDMTWHGLSHRIRDTLENEIFWSKLGDRIWHKIWESISDDLKNALWSSLSDPVQSNPAEIIWSWYRDHYLGQDGAFRFRHYQAANLIGVQYGTQETEQLDHWISVGKSTGIWFPFTNVCLCCERPCVLHYNDDGDLHCDSGPALEFRDGWQVWAIGGIVVDEQIVLQPESQSLEQIQSEKNAEVRRVRIERFGWNRFLEDSGAQVIDSRFNEIEQTEEALMSVANLRVLVCACPSTARVYQLEVDPEITTCEAAQNWLRGDLPNTRIIGSS